MRNRILSIQQELKAPGVAQSYSLIGVNKKSRSARPGGLLVRTKSKDHDKYLIVTGQLTKNDSPVANKRVELVGLWHENGYAMSSTNYIASAKTDANGYFKMALKYDQTNTIEVAARALVKIKVDGQEYLLKPKPMADLTHMLSIIFPGDMKGAILKFLKVRNPMKLISTNFIGLATAQKVPLK